jgi:uncharacterized repeat protein (TIGR01451 family)
MKAKFAFAACALALLATPVLAAAQPEQVVFSSRIQLEKTVTENGAGKLVLSEPKVVVPGDRLLFSTSYRNDGKQPVTNFVVTNPVHAAVSVVSDDLGTAQVSVDGGKTWGLLASLKVADGKGGQRAALSGDVTHVRWTIASIAPGGSGTVEYHAIVR